ncbi:hypothetical protein QC762_701170 [Podospora pseudocomata]|uniref:Uncharacterized protein n=1 Tax=Podospora pseudocomata TaxID=2093779 RepID=A0ABR0G5D9_9PEZI|nr:hypothetical protein QC762_701170 [Podospora pseudocomata]
MGRRQTTDCHDHTTLPLLRWHSTHIAGYLMDGNITLRYVGGFGFEGPYTFLQEALANTTDPLASPYLQLAHDESYISITRDACLAITNMTADIYTAYDSQGIWNRLVTWKFPLVSLLFHFSRPPFPLRVWTNTSLFMLIHLLGSPVTNIASLLHTLSSCRHSAKKMQKKLRDIQRDIKDELASWRLENPLARELVRSHWGKSTSERKFASLWKQLSLIKVSYDEWGVESSEFLMRTLDSLFLDPLPLRYGSRSLVQRREVLAQIKKAADMLAADRATYVLPIFIAQFVFIASISAAFWRVIGVFPQDGQWTNVEAYSIAMSAPFLYMVPAVFLSAIIGVSQTERSVVRVLNDLGEKLMKEEWVVERGVSSGTEGEKERAVVVSVGVAAGRGASPVTSDTERDENPGSEQLLLLTPPGQATTAEPTTNVSAEAVKRESVRIPVVVEKQPIFQRVCHGGIYGWRPEILTARQIRQTWRHVVLALNLVIMSVVVASWISYRVPPEGFNCRNAGQAALLIMWLLSFVLDCVFAYYMDRWGHLESGKGYWYEAVFIKDFIVGWAAVVMILVVQVGIFNRCDCFSLWGKVPVALPQIPEVAAVLMHRISFEWPAVTFGWIAIELGICAVIWWTYRDAFSVYNQEDGGEEK